jgi:hypothetical protein
VPTFIEDGALQCAAGNKEQSSDQDIWQVLEVGGGMLCRILDVSYVVDYDDVWSKLCDVIEWSATVVRGCQATSSPSQIRDK